MKLIFCVECSVERQCILIKGDRAYPHRPDLYSKNFWQCPECFNFVGTHNKGSSKSPLGCIPNKEMKAIRIKIHSLIDPIWKSGRISRSKIYKMISEKVGFQYHTGQLNNLEQANNVYEIAKQIKLELEK